MDRLVRDPGGVTIATRLQIKGSFRDLPSHPRVGGFARGVVRFPGKR
jgi:hypothetical protein